MKDMHMPEILLRAMEPEDLDLLYSIENDMAAWEIGSSNVPYSRFALHKYIAEASGDIYTDQQVRLIVDNRAGDSVGVVDIVNFDAKNLKAEVGIIIRPEYRRRGYASATLQALADYARRILHLHQLYAYVDPTNEASVSLFRKMNYRQSFVLEDWLFDGSAYHPAIMMQNIL